MIDRISFEDDFGVRHDVDWPRCSVDGCKAGVCLGVPDSDRCFPHSGITHAQLDHWLARWPGHSHAACSHE
jgi:hypothetical protein